MPYLFVCLFYAAYFAVPAVQMTFLALYLQSHGHALVAIAYAMTLPWLLRPFLGPVVSWQVDKHHHSGRVMATLIAIALMLILVAAFLPTTPHVLWLWGAAFLFWSSALPLGEALALRLGQEQGFLYAHARLWGSVSFIVMTVVLGLLVWAFGLSSAVVMLILSMVACIVISLLLDGLTKGQPRLAKAPKWQDFWGLCKNPIYLLIILAGAFAQGSHGAYYSFGSVLWTAAGYGAITIGLLWGLGVAAEVGLFRYLPGEGWRAETLLFWAAVAGIVRWSVMAFDPAPVMVAALQFLHALTFGAAHLGAIHGIHRLGGGLQATAQALYAVVQGFAMALGIFLIGKLFVEVNYHAYWVMVSFSLISLMCAALVFVLRNQSTAG